MRTPFLSLACTCALHALAQPGTLDPSFSTDGLQTTDVGVGTYDQAYALAVQPAGGIVLAGVAGYEGAMDFGVVRYLEDGTTDPAFGTNGRVALPVGEADDVARAIALQPDGRIVLGGYSYTGAGIGFALARLNADGTPDTGFGDQGHVITLTPGDITLQARAVAVQDDGRILLAGGGSAGFAIMRYTTTGEADTTFGDHGLVTIHFSNGNDQCTALAVQPDGNILLAGYSNGLVSDSVALARLQPDGSLDGTFGTNGTLRTNYPGLPSTVAAMALMPDGCFVLCGSANPRAIAARLLPDGSPDPGFNAFGWRFFTFPNTTLARFNAVQVQPDGSVLLGGSVNSNAGDLVLVHLREDGTYNPAFGSGGFTITDINGVADDALALALQTDGRILLAGSTNGGASDYDFAAARYLPDLTVTVPEGNEAVLHLTTYPVPFTDVLTVDYTLAVAECVTMDLVGSDGRAVYRLLDNARRTARAQHEMFSVPGSLARGAYVLRCTGDGFRARVLVTR